MPSSKRYVKTSIQIDKDTENRYKTIPNYKDVPISATDVWIQAIEGARLDTIAYDFYGSPKHWWILALANGMGKGTLYVTPGAKLRIPSNPTPYLTEYNKINE